MKKSQVILHALIIPFAIIELYSRWIENVNLEYIGKPLLLIWVAVYFLLYSRKKKGLIIIVLAFLFSWVGDMMLMMAHKNELLFYAGVGGFFIAQLLYIYTFLFVSGDKKVAGFLKYKPVWIIPFVLYLCIIIFLLKPGLEGLMVPIILIYAISLIAMTVSALNRRYRVDGQSFKLVFIGSLFFVISDSMIAINKFSFTFERASFYIILSYIVAQYLIMRGLLKEWEA